MTPNKPLPDAATDERLPSKSAAKREMDAFCELGKDLLALPASQQDDIPLSEDLRTALTLAARLKQREAYRRQLRYIGKLISKENHEAIVEAISLAREQDRFFRQRFHQLESLREDLLADGGEAIINNLVQQHSRLDRQKLRQLVRQAHKDIRDGKTPAGSRKLFRYLRENIEN